MVASAKVQPTHVRTARVQSAAAVIAALAVAPIVANAHRVRIAPTALIAATNHAKRVPTVAMPTSANATAVVANPVMVLHQVVIVHKRTAARKTLQLAHQRQSRVRRAHQVLMHLHRQYAHHALAFKRLRCFQQSLYHHRVVTSKLPLFKHYAGKKSPCYISVARAFFAQ